MQTSTTNNESAWDLSPVFDLLQSLRAQDSAPPKHENEPPPRPASRTAASPPSNDIAEHIKGGLGNFTRLWDYLGVQRDASTPSVPPFEAAKADQAKANDAYTSDGALYYPPSSKLERQKADLWDLTDSPDADPTDTGLTKNQRKKRNRKLRKAAQALTSQADSKLGGGLAQSDDEWETDNIPPYTAKKKAHVSDADIRRKETQSSDNEYRKSTKRSTTAKGMTGNAITATSTHPIKPSKPSLQESSQTVPKATTQAIEEARSKVAAAFATPQKTPDHRVSNTAKTIHESLKKPWHLDESTVAHLQPYGSQSAFSKRVGQTTEGGEHTLKPIPFPIIQQQPPPRFRHEIVPLADVSSVDRNWALLLKLLHNFPEDRKHLVSPLQLSINRPQPDGIHVFVDASNILIGFYDHLKAARGIPPHARVPRVDLNFHALALLLERRRPVAKRVLAGSTPEIQAFEEARQVGYETCILDKVWKAKELTEKQKRYHAKDQHMTGNGYASGSESAGNGGPREPQKAKWVEQAVDEILHLKILESVVDTHIPAEAVPPNSAAVNGHARSTSTGASGADRITRPTMVLATGDAAEAEYSAGFRKMVERALKSGWIVEVMAFGRSVSMDYRRMAKLPLAKGGWGERFRIIELDEYAEELFGETV